MRIALRIERLVLDGLATSPEMADRIRQATELELGRLLAGNDPRRLAVVTGAQASLTAPALRLTGAETPEVLGRRIAHALHGGLGGGEAPGATNPQRPAVRAMPAVVPPQSADAAAIATPTTTRAAE